jgi:hypothetical protein
MRKYQREGINIKSGYQAGYIQNGGVICVCSKNVAIPSAPHVGTDFTDSNTWSSAGRDWRYYHSGDVPGSDECFVLPKWFQADAIGQGVYGEVWTSVSTMLPLIANHWFLTRRSVTRKSGSCPWFPKKKSTDGVPLVEQFVSSTASLIPLASVAPWTNHLHSYAQHHFASHYINHSKRIWKMK